MSLRKIKDIEFAELIDLGGIPVNQALPSLKNRYFDPFLLLHYASFEVRKGTKVEEAGVPPHPHRGFSPISFIFNGEVEHKDSLGNNSIVKSGGSQWVSAGRGIIHSERPSKAFAKSGGILSSIQMWVNTPKSKKFDEPSYISIQADEMPKYYFGKSYASIVSGELNNIKSHVKTHIKLNSYMIYFYDDSTLEFEIDEELNAFVFIVEGTIEIDNKIIGKGNMILFEREGDYIKIKGNPSTKALFMSGEMINEPMVSKGPFVMNNKQEIIDAYKDYKAGFMGELIEKFD